MSRLILLSVGLPFLFAGSVWAQGFGGTSGGSGGTSGSSSPFGSSSSGIGSNSGTSGGQRGGAANASSAGGGGAFSNASGLGNSGAGFQGAGSGNLLQGIGANGIGGANNMMNMGMNGRGMNQMGMGGRNQMGMFGNQNQNQNGRGRTAALRIPIRAGFQPTAISATVRAQNIEGHLVNMPALTSANSVNVTMSGRIAILTGSVASDHEKDLIGRLAMLEPGISSVQNDLLVAAPVSAETLPEGQNSP